MADTKPLREIEEFKKEITLKFSKEVSPSWVIACLETGMEDYAGMSIREIMELKAEVKDDRRI